MHLIYDVFYGNATDPAMRVRETRDEVTGQVIYEDYYTGERVFLFAGDTEICMQLVSDISAEKTGLDFLNECEAHFEIVSEKLSTEFLSVVRQLKNSSLILIKSDKMLKETPFYFTKGRIFHDLFALAATMDGYIYASKSYNLHHNHVCPPHQNPA